MTRAKLAIVEAAAGLEKARLRAAFLREELERMESNVNMPEGEVRQARYRLALAEIKVRVAQARREWAEGGGA